VGKALPWILLGLVVVIGIVLYLRRTVTTPATSAAAPHAQSQAASIASAIAGTATIFKAGASIYDDYESSQ
jgi:hypothetical protein